MHLQKQMNGIKASIVGNAIVSVQMEHERRSDQSTCIFVNKFENLFYHYLSKI